MKLLVDIEANGLNPDTVWCIVAKDLDSGRMYEWSGYEGVYEQREEIREVFSKTERVIFHNGLGYDLYWLVRLGILDSSTVSHGAVVDTLVISRLLNPDREGGHSVEAWAKAKKWPIQKQEHEEWDKFSPEMLERCRSDVAIQEKIYRALQEEAGGWDWSKSIRIEQAIAPELAEQERTGCAFDLEKAKGLSATLKGQMEECQGKLKNLLGYWPVSKGEVKRPFKKDGSYTKMVQDWIDQSEGSKDGENNQGYNSSAILRSGDTAWCSSRMVVGGPFGRIVWEPIELSQNEKVGKRLMQLGWEPTEFTSPSERHPNGLPKLRPNKEPCPNLLKMDNEAGEVLAKYSKYQHRYGQIKGWIENCEERGDGRVSAAVAGITNTGRRKHKLVANVPKAEEEVFLGKEMRSLFIAPPGKVIVGWDAASIQLRIGAHYANDMEFAKALIEGKEEDGTDPHSLVKIDAGLETRAEGKKAVYTGIFGGSEKKFTEEFGPKGVEVRNVIYRRFPGVLGLAPKVNQAAKRGYLVGLDNRKIWMRRDETGKVKAHAGLVTLIQSAEGILMAFLYALLAKKIKEKGLDVKLVIFQHDEIQAEVADDEETIREYSELSRWAMKRAEKFFDFRCPLDIEVKTGKCWADTH